MPDPVAHYVFGMDVLDLIPTEIRQRIDPDIYARSLQGPDPWSTIGFFGGSFKKYANRSNILHKSHTGAFLQAIAEESKDNSEMFSVLAGAICHYCLDRRAHPYIICKGGDFDGTEQTRPQSGGHVRLERAIDSYFIRKRFGKTPWHFSIPRRIMRRKQYPESLREPLDRVYQTVYGWDKVFDVLNRSLRDERYFYGLMQDPFGIVHLLLRPLSKGKTNYCIYSYFRRECDSKVLDYLNESHRAWTHPYDPSLISRESFFDLYDRAKEEASVMITDAYQGKASFGNANYSTGFDWEDPRNHNCPGYEPLQYPHKYWNIP